MTRDMELLIPLARKFNLTYTAFGETIIKGNSPSAGNPYATNDYP